MGNSSIMNATNDHHNNQNSKENYERIYQTDKREKEINDNNFNLLTSERRKDKNKKESEEESNYSEENNDKINDLK